MTDTVLTILLLFGVPGACCFFWVRTYNPSTVRGLLLHTLLFLMISAAVAAGGVYLIFLPADDSYSASNLGALGFTAIIFLIVFGICCLTALLANIGRFAEQRHCTKDKNEDAP